MGTDVSGPTSSPAHLLAVYDFARARIAFDFFGFLVVAEVARRRAGAAKLDLLLVPGDGDGFHANPNYDLAHKQWRLFNIVVQGARLLPSLGSLLLAGSRPKAREILTRHRGSVFPQGYDIHAPFARCNLGWSVMMASLGEDVQVLRASEQARIYIRQWLDGRAGGRKPVVLTLREASFNSQRNVDIEPWLAFAQWLTANGYFPVVLRDIETALAGSTVFEDFEQFPAAVFNLDLRLALYEEAFLNIAVTNGPMQLAFYDRAVRLICFVTGEWRTYPDTPLERDGIAFGEIPPFLNSWQRYAWREPRLDALIEEFTSFVASDEFALAPEALRRAEPIPLLVLAQRFLKHREWDMLEGAVAEAERCGLASDDFYRIRDEGWTSRRELERDTFDLQRAKTLQEMGRLEEAVAVLEALVRRRPDEVVPRLDLGMSLEALDRIEEAVAVYHAAVERGSASPEMVYRLGCIAQDQGALAEARACFETLVDRGIVTVGLRERLARLPSEVSDASADQT